MRRVETHQAVTTQHEAKAKMSSVDAFSPDDARLYARKMFQHRVKGWGDETDALEECAKMARMSARSFKRLMTGETKSLDMGVFARVRRAYLDYCARKAAELLAEIQQEESRSGNVRIGHLGEEVEVLVAKIEAARAVKFAPKKGD